MIQRRPKLSRRNFVRASAVALPALALAACGDATATTNPATATTVAQTQPSTPQAAISTQAQATPTTQAAATQAIATTQPVTTAAPVATTRPVTTAPASSVAPATPTSAPVTTQPVQAQVLAPTPECRDNDEPTQAQTEGPYFKANSPQRTSLLEANTTGPKMVVSGYVLTRACKPVARALIEFWQADSKGDYDNTGFKLRGHLFTDDAGRFSVETIVPGLYTGRTRHIHVKVQAPNQPILTSQLYFPNEPGNQRDSIFRPELVMKIQDSAGSKLATFNFVLNLR